MDYLLMRSLLVGIRINISENKVVFAQFFVALLVQLVLASESLVDPKAFFCIALCGPAVASSSIATDHYS